MHLSRLWIFSSNAIHLIDERHEQELDALVDVNRLCHELLAEHLPLNAFADLWREANLAVNLPLGRVNIHIYSELTSDFFPNYCYNSSTHRYLKIIAWNSDEFVLTEFILYIAIFIGLYCCIALVLILVLYDFL